MREDILTGMKNRQANRQLESRRLPHLNLVKNSLDASSLVCHHQLVRRHCHRRC